MKKEILKKQLNYLKQDCFGELRFILGKIYEIIFSSSTTYISRWNFRIGGVIVGMA